MRSNIQTWTTLLLIGLLAAPQANAAYIYPTHDQGRYGKLLNQIASAGKEIKKWSQFIGSIREQINTLNEVSSGIRDLKGVINESVRGLAGELSAEIGIDKLINPLKDFQGLSLDSQNLLADIRSLPDDAKKALKDIGYAVEDVREFLRNGVVYDTFNRLGVNEWKEVAKDPWDALKNGSVGMAIARSEGYLSEENRGEAWRKYMDSLDEKQKERLGPLIGGAYATHLTGIWFQDMEKRTQRTLDLRKVGNKISNAVEDFSSKNATPEEKQAALEAAKDLRSKLTTLTAAQNWRDRVKINASASALGSQQTILSTETARTKLEAEEADEMNQEEKMNAVLSP